MLKYSIIKSRFLNKKIYLTTYLHITLSKFENLLKNLFKINGSPS